MMVSILCSWLPGFTALPQHFGDMLDEWATPAAVIAIWYC